MFSWSEGIRGGLITIVSERGSWTRRGSWLAESQFFSCFATVDPRSITTVSDLPSASLRKKSETCFYS